MCRSGNVPYQFVQGDLHVELEFCAAASALILAMSAMPCQKGEADPRGLRR
jgi:hypothetical protein